MRFVRIMQTAAVATVLTAAIATPALATSQADQNKNKNHKVGICHATGSKTNPYVYIMVDNHATEAHRKHQDGRDVIGVSGADKCPKKPAAQGSVLGTSVPAPTDQPQPATLPKTGSGLVSLLAALATTLGAGAYYRLKRVVYFL